MSEKRILYFTAGEHALYRYSARRLALEARLTADEAGLEQFRELLRGKAGALYYVMADLAGEDFHEDQIPYLRGSDRQTVIERRLAQRYRDTRLAAALPLGYATGERRNERLLLASFTNTQQFEPWLNALSETGAKLAGVFSAPLLAPALAARLGARGERCFVITANRAGLRQCFIENGRLRFARLERTSDMSPEALAVFVRSETARLAQYLATLRALPREGPPIQVLVLAPPGQRAAFEQALVSDTRLAFLTVGIEDAARTAGLRGLPPDSGAELLFLQLAVRHPPREQFARREDRRSFYIWQLQRGIAAAGALGFAACLLFSGARWLEIMGLHDQAAAQRQSAREAAREYERITATFPVTQTTTENLRATVVEYQKIASRNALPEPALVYVSQVMDQFPQIELDSLTWSVERPGEKGEAKLAAGAAAANATASGELAQVLEISGRVNATQSSDYRAITGQVQRFAEALRADPAYQITRTQLPFDVTSEGTLSGDIGEAGGRGGEAPRFTIVLARKLP